MRPLSAFRCLMPAPSPCPPVVRGRQVDMRLPDGQAADIRWAVFLNVRGGAADAAGCIKRLYSLRSGGGYHGGRKIVFLKARGFRRMMAPFRAPFYNAAEPPPQPSAPRAVKPNPPAPKPVNLKNLPMQHLCTTLPRQRQPCGEAATFFYS